MTLYSKECVDKLLVKIARANKKPLGLGQGGQNLQSTQRHFNTALTKYLVAGIKVSFLCDIVFCLEKLFGLFETVSFGISSFLSEIQFISG